MQKSTGQEILEIVTKNHKEVLVKVAESHKEVMGKFAETHKEVVETKELIMDLAGSVVEFANNTQEQFDVIKGTLANLPTKDYIDDKLGSLKGELVVAVKNGDRKLNLTIDKLENKKVFNSKDKQEILAIELFPREL